MLIVLATSPRVAPGLLSWPAWQALRSADTVLAPDGHPQLPALEAAGIACQLAGEPPPDPDEMVVWLPEPGDDPPVPPGARLIRGSADLPGAHFIDLVATMDRLRVACPWDARQTHASLVPHLLEESYEAVEALEAGDQRAVREELGDVLMQPVFHARIAAERGDGTGYTIDDVADGIAAKLVRRHPHVFGDVTVSGADEVKANWDEIKKREKADRAERVSAAARIIGDLVNSTCTLPVPSMSFRPSTTTSGPEHPSGMRCCSAARRNSTARFCTRRTLTRARNMGHPGLQPILGLTLAGGLRCTGLIETARRCRASPLST